jgi:hypothetical protein
MKPLRMHDVMPRSSSAPDFTALRRILAAFVAAALICVAIAFTLIIRTKPHQPTISKSVRRCNCAGCPR